MFPSCAEFQDSSGVPTGSARVLRNVFSTVRTFEKDLMYSDEKQERNTASHGERHCAFP